MRAACPSAPPWGQQSIHPRGREALAHLLGGCVDREEKEKASSQL